MTNPTDSRNKAVETETWTLNALTEALGDLTVTVSESLSVGRGSDNDVVLGSKQVSRNHAVLSVLDGQLYVKDLDSSNGTFVNNERIEGNKSSLLQVDDTIGFASFNFQVNTSVVDTEAETLAPAMPEDSTISMDTNTEEMVVTQPLVKEPTIKEPVVKKTDIEEMLPTKEPTVPAPSESADRIVETPTPSTATSHEPVNPIKSAPMATNNEPVVEPSPVHEEPAVREEPPVRKEPVVQPDHDKTTTTELQEEADPEVLRAKQAATAQFSGTANLGQGRDLGTEGNNAMDQAVDNSATSGNPDKKPSGSWFIWVFIALIIIGVALWLFNMGGNGPA